MNMKMYQYKCMSLRSFEMKAIRRQNYVCPLISITVHFILYLFSLKYQFARCADSDSPYSGKYLMGCSTDLIYLTLALCCRAYTVIPQQNNFIRK